MKHILFALISLLIPVCSHAGEVYDLGESPTVPDWAIGPLLVVPVDRVQDGHLKVPRSQTRRIGTLQANYIELSGRRFRLASIRLAEVPNSSYRCWIKTVAERGSYFDIVLSQSLYDQTFYYVDIQTMDASTGKPTKAEYFAVWDAKSRK